MKKILDNLKKKRILSEVGRRKKGNRRIETGVTKGIL